MADIATVTAKTSFPTLASILIGTTQVSVLDMEHAQLRTYVAVELGIAAIKATSVLLVGPMSEKAVNLRGGRLFLLVLSYQ